MPFEPQPFEQGPDVMDLDGSREDSSENNDASSSTHVEEDVQRGRGRGRGGREDSSAIYRNNTSSSTHVEENVRQRRRRGAGRGRGRIPRRFPRGAEEGTEKIEDGEEPEVGKIVRELIIIY